MARRALCVGVALASCGLSAAFADTQQATTTQNPSIEEVVVRAHPLAADGLAQPVTTLVGEALDRALAPSLGETLQQMPGVHSASFGHAVGRPIVRGLGGPRVKVLEDRIDSLDVSVSSPDHLTTIEPFAAQSIEVLKGPSTLLYGTGAIGGVVNVHTGRVLRQAPDKLDVGAELRGADNADQFTAAGRLEAGVGRFAFHVDGFYRDADPYEIPGEAESAALRALEEAEGEHEEEHEDEEEHADDGTLAGSELETRGGAFGVSYIGDRGFVGIAVSAYDATYGLPGHSHAHEHGEEEEEHDEEEHGEHGEEEGTPILDLDQTRIDFEAGLDAPFQGIESLNLRLGYNDYEHVEAEANGEQGTVFATEALEGRAEFSHVPALGITGTGGVQFSTREFSAIGEEAFVRPVDTDTIGLFYVGQRELGDSALEAGVRYEHVSHDPTEGASRDFDLFAASIGLVHPFGDHWAVSAQVDYSSRAPVAEELYSNGPHLATQSFEIGDAALDEEEATNVSVALAYERQALRVGVSGYFTDFNDFIYQRATGGELDELPVLQWEQNDAEFYGAELDASWRAASWDTGSLTLNLGFDVVRARLDRGENRDLPRIPPRRWRLGALLSWGDARGEVVWRHVSNQRDVAPGELPTDSYDDLAVNLAYEMNLGGNSVQLFFAGRNLTDDEQRYHTSFIKDLAPQPGRTFEIGVRLRR